VPTLEDLEIADEPADWRALGFEVEDGACQVSSVRLRLVGKGPQRGILGWKLAALPAAAAAGRPQPNGVTRIDHVVLLTPDLDRTVEELRSEGPDGPARLWGIAFVVDDIDATGSALGELLGAPRDAVQAGRKIATLRPEAGLGPAIAFMTPP
jgi:hypothetical protein